MHDIAERFATAVLGAGRSGLLAALRLQAAGSDSLLVVDRAPQPGGAVQTHRTNGFVCDLGPFAFTAAEVAPFQALLPRLSPPLTCRPQGLHGALFDGVLRPVAVSEPPLSFRGGNEELVQACRRQLGTSLRLGREVTSIRPAAASGDGFVVTLGGEIPSEVLATRLVMALPTAAAARLLGAFDPALPEVAARLRSARRALIWFGGDENEAPELTGYGVLAAPELVSPMAEVIFCSQVFAGRALTGRFLVRCELLDGELADDELLAHAERELRRWTGTRAAFALRKVHRFDDEIRDGAWVECRARLRELTRRVPGLTT